ncbi:DNA-dependent RNA polymerase auxiliary subunit epsilon [Bacillus pakistanensis]|uniref:DNA-directed RNA polymerase subunit epsilon n=1 Tax=Rossellomorea pakistanensis TaxID=992288 RepID=A0ABS2NFR2_9BACI|nr:DNA-directed RNA polymerase subunit epsilon [Bacillus pakistanensis]MBM7586660.1 DNA-dependent RNA polymerase auxiliary subunit epsilon [Bacillus pakistanensis]
MIYKVYYQESKLEVPVRESTKALYVEAESEREVRLKLKEEPYNIEFVQKLDDSHLEYEQQSENYKVEN